VRNSSLVDVSVRRKCSGLKPSTEATDLNGRNTVQVVGERSRDL
jgi:hypothetical protein